MNKLLKTFGLLDNFEKIGMMIATLAIFMMMILTTIDVLLRKILGSGIDGLFELTQDYLLVPLIFFALSYLYVKGGHVRITLFERFIPLTIRPLLTRILDFGALVFWALVTIKAFDVAKTAFISNEVSNGILGYPMWMSYMIVPIGTGLLTLRVLQKIIFPQSVKTDLEDVEDQVLIG